MAKIEVQNLSFAYKKDEKKILSNFNFCLNDEEIVRLTGKNGQGKSTLIKLILGFFKWYDGDIILEGNDIKQMNLGQIGNKIAYLMDNPERQLFALTVLKEKTFIQDLTGKKASEITENLFKEFDLYKYESAYPLMLSQGEIQKLAIATLNFDADFFFFDEPTLSLDSESKVTLKRLFKHLLGLKKGILLVSHDTDFLNDLSFREVALGENDE